jgi:hypothetical protein
MEVQVRTFEDQGNQLRIQISDQDFQTNQLDDDLDQAI